MRYHVLKMSPIRKKKIVFDEWIGRNVYEITGSHMVEYFKAIEFRKTMVKREKHVCDIRS